MRANMRKWILPVALSVILLAVSVAGLTGTVFKVGPPGQQVTITLGHVSEAAGVADYTFDGVDDNVQLQAALSALPATGGRLVIASAVQLNLAAATTVTRAIANVTIEGTGRGTYFVGDGATAIFTAGGNNWVFSNLRTDAGGITMGATTGWVWNNVTINATYYTLRTPTDGNITVGAVTDSGLTAGRVTFAGAGGLLSDDADLTFAGSTTTMTNATVSTLLTAKTGRTATIVIAASDSTATAKAQADYVLTGAWVADTTTVETAINNAASDTDFYFPPGTYTLQGIRLLDVDRMKFYGVRGATIFTPPNQYSSALTANIPNNTQAFADVADASLFRVGQHVLAVDDTDASTDSKEIISIVANRLNFDSNIITNAATQLDVADNGRVLSVGLMFYFRQDADIVSDIEFDGISFDMNGGAYIDPITVYGLASCAYNHSIRFIGGVTPNNGITIRNIDIYDSKGTGISMHDATDVLITGNTINSRTGVSGENALHRITVANNQITVYAGQGVAFETAYAAREVRDIIVTGNWIYTTSATLAGKGITAATVGAGAAPLRTLVTGNIVRGLFLRGISSESTDGVTVSGNVVTGAGIGISVGGGSSRLTVADNSLYGAGATGGEYGIHISGKSGAISGNVIENFAQGGISNMSSSANNTGSFNIFGNTIKNNGLAVTDTHSGISIDYADNNSIHDNLFVDDTPKMAFQIRIDSNSSGTRVYSNKMVSGARGYVLDDGADSLVELGGLGNFTESVTWGSLVGFTTGFDASGNVTAQGSTVALVTDANLNDDAFLYSIGTWNNLVQSTKAVEVEWIIANVSDVTDFTAWLRMGASVADPPSETIDHFGFKIIDNAIWASTGSGAAQTITDTTSTLSTGAQWTRLRAKVMYISGSGSSRVKFYVNDVLKVTTTTNVVDAASFQLHVQIRATTTDAVDLTLGKVTINKEY